MVNIGCRMGHAEELGDFEKNVKNLHKINVMLNIRTLE